MSTEQAPYGVPYIASAPEELKVGDRVKTPDGTKALIAKVDDNGTAWVKNEDGSGYGFFKKEHLCALRKLPDTISFEDSDNPTDRQVGGNHYDMPIQPVEFIERNGLGFCVGNCIKYLCRYQKKNGKQDLEKAKHYIDLLIQLEYPE